MAAWGAEAISVKRRPSQPMPVDFLKALEACLVAVASMAGGASPALARRAKAWERAHLAACQAASTRSGRSACQMVAHLAAWKLAASLAQKVPGATTSTDGELGLLLQEWAAEAPLTGLAATHAFQRPPALVGTGHKGLAERG